MWYVLALVGLPAVAVVLLIWQIGTVSAAEVVAWAFVVVGAGIATFSFFRKWRDMQMLIVGLIMLIVGVLHLWVGIMFWV
jgi:hypothetical protein